DVLIVLCYAQWEGYLNYCVRNLIRIVNESKLPAGVLMPGLLVCELGPILESAIDRRFSFQSKIDMARQLNSAFKKMSVIENYKLVGAASNLDFKRLAEVFSALGIRLGELAHHKTFIERQLVAWRHQVAHGDAPNLEGADLIRHSQTTESLLTILGDKFSDRAMEIDRQEHQLHLG
ncbi:MAE_28990/MAE_18760 family HEPN-like nuclease, partial [Paracoccus sp. (in: a-proteobacteria)]|uniref:MAE_28990/MAE_18760 family HEPN-like nuclease n=1 Tax=Paracoccus sp. TaxID=267 RepID=UPI0035AEA6D0